MKKVLIYDDEIFGHHLEYIHHIHERAVLEQDMEFVFVCPEKFLELKGMLDWTGSTNVRFDFLSAEEYADIHAVFRTSFSKSAKALGRRVRKYRPDEVFLIVLPQVVPFDLAFIRGKVKISGIIYSMLPLQLSSLSWRRKLVKKLTYKYLFKSSRYKDLYVLNSHSYTGLFNSRYRTGKFKYLTDPIPISPEPGESLRGELGIPEDARVFLHLGAMRGPKGTLAILDALKSIPAGKAEGMYFIFAGRIQDDIKEEFYRRYGGLKDSYNLILKDEFLPFTMMNSLYKTCDVVLAPYYDSFQSSGVVGCAALFHKPIIVLEDGFAADLVKEYRLGRAVKPEDLPAAIQDCGFDGFAPERYVREHTIDEFTTRIFSGFAK